MLKNNVMILVSEKEKLFAYGAIHPEDFEILLKNQKKLYIINKLLSKNWLKFSIKIKLVNRKLKRFGLRNIVIFNEDNVVFFKQKMTDKSDDRKGWLLTQLSESEISEANHL